MCQHRLPVAVRAALAHLLIDPYWQVAVSRAHRVSCPVALVEGVAVHLALSHGFAVCSLYR